MYCKRIEITNLSTLETEITFTPFPGPDVYHEPASPWKGVVTSGWFVQAVVSATYRIPCRNRDNDTGSRYITCNHRGDAFCPAICASKRKRQDIQTIFVSAEKCIHEDCRCRVCEFAVIKGSMTITYHHQRRYRRTQKHDTRRVLRNRQHHLY